MYKSALCHLHAIFEGLKPSMSGYCYEAKRFGVDIVWISDHDNRFFRDDFYNIPLDGDYELKTIESPDLFSVDRSESILTLNTSSSGEDWKGISVDLPYLRSKHRPPLLINPVITMKMNTNFNSENARMVLKFHLCQVPPSHEIAHMEYYYGQVKEDGLPLPLENGQIKIDLAKDIEKKGLNKDHNLVKIELILETCSGESAQIDIEEITLKTDQMSPLELLDTQKKLGDEIGKEFDIDVLVNFEVGAEEGHVSCYGKHTIEPVEYDGRPPCEEVIQYIERNGGIASINHPFTALRQPFKEYRGKINELDDEKKEELLQTQAEIFIEKKAYGAHMIEIGYPEKRNGYEPPKHLKFWDILNLNGLKIPGIGVSDAHANRSWDKGFNFANYIASPDCNPDNLIKAMKKGDFYMADPSRVKGKLQFKTDSGKTMGDIENTGELLFEIDGIPNGSEFRWIIDGKCVKKELTTCIHRSKISLDTAKHFVRAELLDTYKRPILITNPLWAS